MIKETPAQFALRQINVKYTLLLLLLNEIVEIVVNKIVLLCKA